MVLLTERRRKRGPIKSTVGAFPEVFSTADNRSESKDGRREASVCMRKALGEFGDDRSTFIECRGHSGIVGSDERSN